MSAKRSKRISGGEGWTLNAAQDDTAPKRSGGAKVAKLRMERRKGKPTTILYDLQGVSSMKTLAKELKTLVSAGGTTKDGKIEIQGEHRDKFRVYLRELGYEVKG